MSNQKYDKPDPSPAKLYDGTRVGTVPFVYRIPDPPEIPFLNTHNPVAMFLLDKSGGGIKKNIPHVLPPLPYRRMLEVVEGIHFPHDLVIAGYRLRVIFERILPA